MTQETQTQTQEELEAIIRNEYTAVFQILHTPSQIGEPALKRHQDVMAHVYPARTAFTTLTTVIGLEEAINRWTYILGEVFGD